MTAFHVLLLRQIEARTAGDPWYGSSPAALLAGAPPAPPLEGDWPVVGAIPAESRRAGLDGLARHDADHNGQVAVLRRALGL